MDVYSFVPGQLTHHDIDHLIKHSIDINLEQKAWQKVIASQEMVQQIVESNTTVYGINTGFGLLANESISQNELQVLQQKILLSHAAGTGELLSDDIVKLILLFKINSLARGYSGVRPIIIKTLIKFYNKGILPCVPSKGSVGASGDLAPLAHLALPLIGEGKARFQNEIISGSKALELINQEAIKLAPKEGLALINGTQVSTAIAYYHLLHAKKLLRLSICSGAMSVDAAKGSDNAFHPLIHEARGQDGQIKVAQTLKTLMKDSQIRASHENCSRVQDPYCLRCIPQVIGACLDNIKHVESILTKEANATTDNPLIFSEEQAIYSGGNFHAEPVAQAADLLAIAVAEIGAIAERRIALLIDPNFSSGLPPFLVKAAGLNSGFMIGHVTAAALASENKSIAHPASVDSLPTSANQEDHVSMATFAAMRLKVMNENVQTILIIELLAACQGIDLRAPVKTSKELQSLLSMVREHVEHWHEDRNFSEDLEKLKYGLPKIMEWIGQLDIFNNSDF